jgi:hypothetical protein
VDGKRGSGTSQGAPGIDAPPSDRRISARNRPASGALHGHDHRTWRAQFDSAEIDVGGAQHVTVNLGIKGAGANVEIVIVYIHRVTGGVAPVAVHNETVNPSTAEDLGM